MTKQYLTGMRSALVCAAIAAVVFVPTANTVAQKSPGTGPAGLVDSDTGDNIKRATLYPRANYDWPYATGPYYGDAVAGVPGTMRTMVGSFHLSQGELPFPTELKSPDRLAQIGVQHFVLQLHPELDVRKDIMGKIEASGGRIASHLSDGAMIVEMNIATLNAVQDSVGVLGLMPYHAAFKLHPAIGRAPLPDPIKAVSSVYELDVMLWSVEDGERVAQELRELGVTVNGVWGDQLRVEADRSLLASIAQNESVMAIFESLPMLLHAEETTTTMQTGQYNGGEIPYHDAGIGGGGSGDAFCFPADVAYTPCTVATQVADCPVSNICGTATTQVLMVLDSGMQLDAGDLSHTSAVAGSASASHRKVRLYEATNQFGGVGDLLGCDSPQQGGFSHGHVVSATALGNGTAVAESYGTPWVVKDPQNNPWKVDGVAYQSKLVFFDAQVTPPSASCGDPLLDTISPGDLWNPGTPTSSSLGKAYVNENARIFNFSWGSPDNSYTGNAIDIDNFIATNRDAMVFVSAGNNGEDVSPADGIPDSLTLGTPATTRNGLAIGASRNANLGVDSPQSREAFSSVGPAVDFANVNRIAPQLMAPGGEPGGGSLGIPSEFACRSSDNDQLDPVECDLIQGVEGTSFSSPAAAGAALVIRDYFSQGFYPDGAGPVEADRTTSISGALVKAILIASADWMNTPPGVNLTKDFRFNNEQGYGRIQLDNALPISNWVDSPTGLIVHDPYSNTSSLSMAGALDATTVTSTTDTFTVCNDTEELSVVLAWTDRTSGTQAQLLNDLDLTVTSPSGKTYKGNFFSDDANRSGNIENTPFLKEDCPPIGSRIQNLEVDAGPWSLPACANAKLPAKGSAVAPFDPNNPTEAVFLSPDPEGNESEPGYVPSFFDGQCDPGSTAPGGTNALGLCSNDLDCSATPSAPLTQDNCVGGTRQVELGQWSVTVAAKGSVVGNQDFALAIAGGVCLGSSVRFTQGAFTCNDPARVQVSEFADGADTLCPDAATCTSAVVQSRTTVRAFRNGVENDCEGPGCAMNPTLGLTFTQNPNSLLFTSNSINLTDGTVAEFGNGTLDIRDGDVIQVTYADDDGFSGIDRKSSANVGCQVALGFGAATFIQFGQDTSVLVQGGCERALPRHERCVGGFCSDTGGACAEDVDCPMVAAGYFEFGFPDRYMDADELIQFNVAFNSEETVDLDNVSAALSCVSVDQDSPKDCLPSGANCLVSECGGECDPRRENNTTCPYATVLNSPQILGRVPSGELMTGNFAIQMADELVFNGTSPTVEFIFAVTASTSGKTASGLAVNRQRLNVDTVEKLYNTDFPTGGVTVAEVLDMNNNERQDDPINDLSGFQGFDYRFESKTYSDMTETGRNLGLLSPWNFDGNNGGFTNGLNSTTTEAGALSNNIFNWGEDKNFNGIEDGTCLSNPAIACWSFPTDARCPGGSTCQSNEDAAQDNQTFTQNHNQRGGCGWQTKAPHRCTGDSSRSCYENPDCQGTCQRTSNDILSTFAACSGVCPTVNECNSVTSDFNLLGDCADDFDCSDAHCSGGLLELCTPDGPACSGGTCVADNVGSCGAVNQDCIGNAGTCNTGTTAATGGVWHTGTIGDRGVGDCITAQCRRYKVITTNNNDLQWWELLLTPVMEKVDQTLGADGLPNSVVNIAMWGWNQTADLPDNRAIYTWEFDTDTETLFPVDLISDGTVLNFGGGGYGAVTNENNPQLTNGFNLFAPMGKCSASTGTCNADEDCPGAQTCVQQDFSYNGQDAQGNNRHGANSCFFEGPGTITADAFFGNLGTSNPIDDDVDNDNIPDGLIDEFVTPAGPLRNHDIVSFNGSDMRLFTLEDLFQDTGDTFQAALGLLNLEGATGNSATQGFGLAVDDMFVEWKEFVLNPDITSCATGQCAVMELPSGQLYEGVTSIPVSLLDGTPYGFACVGGPNVGDRCFPAQPGNSCSPGSCMPAENDCNFNGKFNDLVDDDDCDNNGTPDVVVLATSEVDFGEIVTLNLVAPGGKEYKGTLAVSVLANSEGVLYLSQIGEELPTVTVTYDDNNDGTENLCQNNVVPDNQGRIQAFATVNVQACDVQVVATSFTDNGDGDLFADSSETISLDFDAQSNCGFGLTNCVARLSSNSDTVECIKQGTVVLGDFTASAPGNLVSSPASFVYKLTDDTADRTGNTLGPNDTLSAAFNISISCDQIDGLQFPQNFSQSLDLNLNDLGQPTTPFTESFDGGGGNPADPFQGTKFEAQNIDAGIPGPPGNLNGPGLINGDGWRCQYTDPDWVNSASYNQDSALDCFPGMTLAHANAVWWAIDGTGIPNTPDGGRAFGGTRSMYYGIFLNDPQDDFTTPLSLVESAATNQVINLGAVSPKLSFWHQVSLADHRTIQAADRRSADRGAVQIQVITGEPDPPWMNLQAIQNGYDEQNADNFFNCEFDPVDDGNTEDDFFDPTDPDRDSGPSSTCFPEFTWAWMGSTTGSFNVADVGHASTPPSSSDTPAVGDGTWVETIVDLGAFRGRQAKFRFLVTSIKATAENMFEQFGDNNEGDDGWWVDEFEIDQTLATPAFFENDDFDLGTCSGDGSPCIGQCKFAPATDCDSASDCPGNLECLAPCPNPQSCTGPPPACGATCNVVTARAFVTPNEILNPGTIPTGAPGQVISINGAAATDISTGAEPSSSDACLSGNLQFQFCRDGDPLGGGPALPDGDCDDAEDLLIRSWTENALLTVAPQQSATYSMQVRCSTAQGCLDVESVFVDVECPGGQNALGLKEIFWTDKTTVAWQGGALDVDIWQSIDYTNTGSLDNYPGSFTDNQLGVTSFAVPADPPLNNVQAILVKSNGPLNTVPVGFFCNSRTWRSGGASEINEDGTFSGVSSLGRDSTLGERP
jgi:hypothetical protein